MLALGSRPNDFAIAGLAQRALSLYSASDAERVGVGQHRAHGCGGGQRPPSGGDPRISLSPPM